jgi:hypothetical protein
MGYYSALEAAGAKVLEFKEFGSYQGTWLAILDTGLIVEGNYGSCSGCDSFQAEFDYGTDYTERDGKFYSDYNEEITEDEYNKGLAAQEKKLADFGRSYVDSARTYNEIYEKYKADAKWDYESEEIVTWLQEKISLWRITKIDNIIKE